MAKYRMAKYRKKPVVVHAVQLMIVDADGFVDLPVGVFTDEHGSHYVTTAHDQKAYVKPGDWIIAESDGRGYYPCKPDIFDATYEKVNDDADTGDAESGDVPEGVGDRVTRITSKIMDDLAARCRRLIDREVGFDDYGDPIIGLTLINKQTHRMMPYLPYQLHNVHILDDGGRDETQHDYDMTTMAELVEDLNRSQLNVGLASDELSNAVFRIVNMAAMREREKTNPVYTFDSGMTVWHTGHVGPNGRPWAMIKNVDGETLAMIAHGYDGAKHVPVEFPDVFAARAWGRHGDLASLRKRFGTPDIDWMVLD